MALSLDEQRGALASWMPPGIAWLAFRLAGTNAYMFLNGLAVEFVRLAGYITEGRVTIPNVNNNGDFIEEWEAAMGIPDDCFLATGDLEERWTHVLAKFALMNVQTSADFAALGAVFGLTVTAEGGIGSPLYPASFSSDKEARNTIVITFDVEEPNSFPFTFPFTFEQSQTTIMQCMFDKLRPANNQILYRFI